MSSSRAVALGVALLAHAGEAAAETPVTTTIDFSAPPACIDGSTFRANLSSLPMSSLKAEQPRAMIVRITASDGAFHGELTVKHADGTRTLREVDSPRCDDVTSALEFIAAVALGLDRSPPPHEKRKEASTPPVVSPPVTPSSPAARWRFVGEVWAGVTSGAGPRAEFAPGAAIGAMLDAPGLLAPELLLSGNWATSGGIATPVGQATLTLADGALTGCPLRLAAGAAFGLRPCAELQLGALSASGSGATVVPPTSQVRPWGAIAALGRIEWKLRGAVELEAAGGALFPFISDSFFFTPSVPIGTSQVGAFARLGIAIVWPP
jgi:hypothetical protein